MAEGGPELRLQRPDGEELVVGRDVERVARRSRRRACSPVIPGNVRPAKPSARASQAKVDIGIGHRDVDAAALAGEVAPAQRQEDVDHRRERSTRDVGDERRRTLSDPVVPGDKDDRPVRAWWLMSCPASCDRAVLAVARDRAVTTRGLNRPNTASSPSPSRSMTPGRNSQRGSSARSISGRSFARRRRSSDLRRCWSCRRSAPRRQLQPCRAAAERAHVFPARALNLSRLGAGLGQHEGCGRTSSRVEKSRR